MEIEYAEIADFINWMLQNKPHTTIHIVWKYKSLNYSDVEELWKEFKETGK